LSEHLEYQHRSFKTTAIDTAPTSRIEILVSGRCSFGISRTVCRKYRGYEKNGGACDLRTTVLPDGKDF
jgi:hypothetical protein